MYPAVTPTDYQIAQFHHRQLLAIGTQQQFVARECPPVTSSRHPYPAIRRYAGSLLVAAGQRLQGSLEVTGDRRDAVSGAKRIAAA